MGPPHIHSHTDDLRSDRCLNERKAPELLSGESKGDAKADVYSFGVLLSELLTSQKPWNEIGLQQIVFKVVQKQKPSFTPKEAIPLSASDVMKLASECMNYDPAQRPTFVQIVPRLEAALAAVTSEFTRPVTASPATEPKRYAWSRPQSLESSLTWSTPDKSNNPAFELAELDLKVPLQKEEFERVRKF